MDYGRDETKEGPRRPVKAAGAARPSSSHSPKAPPPPSVGKRRRRLRHEGKGEGTTAAATNTGVADGTGLSPTSMSTSRGMGAGVCERVSSRYEKVGRIGEGTYGVVYSAIDRTETKRRRRRKASAKPAMVALKRCLPHHEASDGFPVTTLREIHALRVCCSHPNVVSLLEVAVGGSGGGVFLVFEHCQKDVAQILDAHHHRHHHRNNKRSRAATSSSSPFTEAQAKALTHQLLSALEHCHRHFLIHRDVKPSNLLYSYEDDDGSGNGDGETEPRGGVLKLADFGLSRHCTGIDDNNQPPLTPNVVSRWYRAPELMMKKARRQRRLQRRGDAADADADDAHDSVVSSSYSFPIDLWAVGCVLSELLQGYPLLEGQSEADQLRKMVDCLGTPPSRIYEYGSGDGRNGSIGEDAAVVVGLWDRFDKLSPEGLTLLTGLLEYDPRERWTATQALEEGSAYFHMPPVMATKLPRFFDHPAAPSGAVPSCPPLLLGCFGNLATVFGVSEPCRRWSSIAHYSIDRKMTKKNGITNASTMH